jgi:Domain of unknown function (DUF4905)
LSEKHFKPFSILLPAPVWNLLPHAQKPIIVIEQRNEEQRSVAFSGFDFVNQKFLWRDVVLTEKWWVNLVAVEHGYAVLKVFESMENPDKTSLCFLSLEDGKILKDQRVEGYTHTNNTVHPFQYLEGDPDFETVKNFIQAKGKAIPRLGAEYLEYEGFIFISYYLGDPLANCLAIFNAVGDCVYEEKIGTNLKGIGVNTFFIASGYLFFVKNKIELVTFRIV